MDQCYWLVIDVLSDAVAINCIDHDKFQEARLRLSVALDERMIYNLPTDELKRLQGVLDCLEYDVIRDE